MDEVISLPVSPGDSLSLLKCKLYELSLLSYSVWFVPVVRLADA